MNHRLVTMPLLVAFALAPCVCVGCGAFPLAGEENDPSANQEQGIRGDEDTLGPPTGYIELIGLLSSQAGWDDPSSPFVQLAADMELPERLIPFAANELQFILFDEAGIMALTLKYNIDENTLYYDGGGGNPFFSRVPVRSETAWQYTTEMGQPGDPVTSHGVFRLTIHDLLEGQQPTLAIQLEFTLAAVQDIPADPQAGREAIPAGSSATWSRSETYSFQPSQSPFTLFPNAQVKPLESQ